VGNLNATVLGDDHRLRTSQLCRHLGHYGLFVVKIETHRSFLLSSPHATGKSRRTHGDLDQEEAIRCRVA
jgi:hypothetical protein